MAHSPTALGQDPLYEPFLYATVGDDNRGVSVTVLSMLARLGVDPWGEASVLAKLPIAAARQRLEALLARFYGVPALVPDQGKIVTGLLSALPKPSAPIMASADGILARPSMPALGSLFYWILAVILILGWVAILSRGN